MPRQYAIHQKGILGWTENANMQIGDPLRTFVVEPLELPFDEPQEQPEPTPQEPEPETEPATK
jgi:hypothetical protein